jgi:RNA polymerase sigma-70 factor, ECF subfamily
MSDQPRLEAAIEQVKSGDREAFSVVVEHCHIRLRTYISTMVFDASDADDLAQQAFIFAYQNIGDYQAGTNFVAWLKAIAYNLVRDYRSHAMRTLNVLQELRHDISNRVNESQEGSINERLEVLESCIKKLPEGQREFLRAVCARQSTLESVASDMNRSGPAVRKHLSRLYEALRECVQSGLIDAREVSV